MDKETPIGPENPRMARLKQRMIHETEDYLNERLKVGDPPWPGRYDAGEGSQARRQILAPETPYTIEEPSRDRGAGKQGAGKPPGSAQMT
jgi:hypothetical protein